MISKRLYHNDIITVPEFFRVHYGSRALECVYGVIFILVYVFYLVSQYKGFGMVAAAMFDIPYSVGVCMVYLFIVYTTFGGYRSVVRTDVFNLILLVISLAVICVNILSQSGGFWELIVQAGQVSGLAHSGMSQPTPPGGLFALFSDRYTPLSSLSMFCGWGLGLAANPQYVVRLLSARNERTARNTVLCSLVLLSVIIFMLVIIGLGMRVLVPSLTSPESTDGIFIRLINHELYSPWSGFFLFSVMGACISTANSQLLLIASSFSYDVVNSMRAKPLREKQVVWLGRLAILVCGTLSMLLTLDPPAFTLAYGGDIWGVVSILLFPPLYGTLLGKKITCRGVWACVIVGILSIAAFYPLHDGGGLRAHPAMYGVLLSTGAMFAVSAVDRRRGGGTP